MTVSEVISKTTEIITRTDIEASQQAWAEGLIDIGRVHQQGDDYQARARQHVATLYAYDLGQVLFKPTKASQPYQFRPTPESAVSYFVGANSDFPKDHGFALNPWIAVRFENTGIIEGQTALAQGNYFFTGLDGQETQVEYSFGYLRDPQGKLRICLHHSSLPYNPSHNP